MRKQAIKNNLRDPTLWLVVALACTAYFPFLFATQALYPLSTHEWDLLGNWLEPTTDAGYWDTQIYRYQTKTGRYSRTALLTTFPYWYSLTAFRLFILIDFLLIPVATWWLFRGMLPSRSATLITAMALMLYLYQLSNIYDSLLRFSCILIYHGGIMTTPVFAGLLIRQSRLPEPN